MSSERRFLSGPAATLFAAGKTGLWRSFRPVVDQDACNRCGKCARFCPVDVIDMDRKDWQVPLTIDMAYCKGCGICVDVCPITCMQMVPERSVT